MRDLREIVATRIQEEIPPFISRNEVMSTLPIPSRFNRVNIITGMRRCGKTFYLFQRMQQLLDQGIPKDRIFYFDFSDDRLPTDEQHIIDLVLDEYWRQVPAARTNGAYLFFDEVQDCDGWQGSCRRIAADEQVTLVVTGSSSKVSSSEIATQFRGRSYTHEMLPLSFAEFARFHAEELPTGIVGDLCTEGREFSSRERTALEALFDRYLVVGGFPDVQQDVPATRIETLQGYVRDVVARDVAERMARPTVSTANQLALLVLRNTSCELSVNGMVEILRASGRPIGWERANEMAELLRQAYLYFEVYEYSRALLAGGTNPPKAYAVDPGLAYAVSRASQEDIGKRLETTVYLELRRRFAGRRTDAICSYTVPGKQGRKVDFLAGEAYAGEERPQEPYELIQVSAYLDNERTRTRELSSLDAAMGATGLKRGTIITLDESSQVTAEHGVIQIFPAWKWFLSSGVSHL